MPNNVIFDYDRASKTLFVEDHWEIKTKQDVDEFFAQYDRQMKLVGEKFWMVAHIDGLSIHAEIVQYYGEAARRATSDLLLGLARWGTDSVARMSLRTTAMKSGMPYNIYSSREEAIRAVEKMKAEGTAK